MTGAVARKSTNTGCNCQELYAQYEVLEAVYVVTDLRRVLTLPGKSWIFFLKFPGPGKSWKMSMVLEITRN